MEAQGTPEVQTWYSPNDPIAGMYSFLALTRFLQGDLADAEKALLAMEKRCELTRIPPGPVEPVLRARPRLLDSHRSRPTRPCQTNSSRNSGRGAGRTASTSG